MKGKNETFLSMFLGSYENISKPPALIEQYRSDFIKPATGSTLNLKLTNDIYTYVLLPGHGVIFRTKR